MSKIQVKPEHYFNLKYDSKARWISYWYQINEVLNLKPKNILEIGIGNKTVSDYLKKLGFETVTCDFDKSLKPDVVGNVMKLPFKKNSFDLVLCAEVLEHLPFEKFPKALREIKRVSRHSVVITLPHFSITNLYFALKIIPFIPRKEIMVKVDFPIKHVFSAEHYWEIGKKSFSVSKVRAKIKNCGFFIEKDYYPKENPYHHFFILKKSKNGN